MDRISELPREILQQILYFLSQEEAVRTSVLSKSWRHIWCTRPNLHLSCTSFNRELPKFLFVMEKTLQRYCDERLSLKEFHLSILPDALYDESELDDLYDESELDDLYDESELVSLLEKWIPLFTTMGVKMFRLSINRGFCGKYFKLPDVVVESLQDLFLGYSMLNEKNIQSILLCKHLRHLCLQDVFIEDYSLPKIISSYPLIETLKIKVNCRRLGTIKLINLHNLKHFFLHVYGRWQRGSAVEELISSIEIYPLSLETLNIDLTFYTDEIYDCRIWFDKGADFHNLSVLNLLGVKSSLEHLSSCKFPSLERLSLTDCDGLEGIHLFIDAPKMKIFHYGRKIIPSFSFATTSTKWKSDMRIKYIPTDDGSWFLKLNELLNSLRQSKISLTISHSYIDIIQENVPVRESGYNEPVAVESVDFEGYFSSLPCLVSGIFAICRPRQIGTYRVDGAEMRMVGFLWKILVEGESGKINRFAQLPDKTESGTIDQFTQFLLLRDLEDVNFEMKKVEEWNGASLSEDDGEEWYRATLSDFLVKDELLCLKFRFVLKWRETPYMSHKLH